MVGICIYFKNDMMYTNIKSLCERNLDAEIRIQF